MKPASKITKLIDLCLARPGSFSARFIFFGSIGTIMGTSGDVNPKRLPSSLSEAKRTGYSRSKHVAETISAKAASDVGLPVAVVRIGQIVGDTVSGIWTTSGSATDDQIDKNH
ncbi:hypothetical protein FSARC_13528 [Fusarium sarcochroum]|uniref:Thioester reductase (TE) domain-containing protein n=1 Tax=Fusarium sarcochroum TaxID=1208366 RepID=A0A8H4T0Q2_9HYPO|nr:hypothetical protein FSARC_13528 [Fusarium sarcochroum]